MAITKKGSGSAWVVPSTVTCRSAMASSNDDWVRGVARLSSSTRTTLLNSGPGWNVHSRWSSSNTVTPVRSDGSRSGVPWTRPNDPPMARAMALASTVLPTPGMSSNSTCPPAR